MKKSSPRIAICAIALSVAGMSSATIDTHKYETKTVSNTAEFIQALTDAVATNALYTYGRYHCTFKLNPGTYDVSTLNQNANYHIYLPTFYDGQILGLGAKPGDVVITGGGKDAEYSRGVMYVSSGSFHSFVVSNVTVTGGYTAGNGGGICSGESLLTKIKDCIITNNYSGSMGGGVFRANLERCLVRDNAAANRGGGVASCPNCSDCDFISNRVTVSTMGTTGGGGGVWGVFTRCLFQGNTSTADAGGLHAATAIDCVFDGNYAGHWRYGGHARTVTCTNCVFRNNDTRLSSNYFIGSIVYESNLSQCVITNHAGTHYMLAATSMDRCYYAHNVGLQENARPVSRENATTVPLFTNCIFEDNDHSIGAWATIVGGCDVINCTFVNNTFYVYPNFGAMPCGGRVVNCVFSGNAPFDTSDAGGQMSSGATAVTNCFWVTEWGGQYGPKAGTYFGGGKVASMRLETGTRQAPRFAPRISSPARDAGLSDSATLAAVGAVDFYGRPRVVNGRIDAGAVEGDSTTGFSLIVK